MIEEVLDDLPLRRIVAAILQNAADDVLSGDVGLRWGAWHWLRSEEVREHFDLLDIDRSWFFAKFIQLVEAKYMTTNFEKPVYIVNRKGAVHGVTEAHAKELLSKPGNRLATAAEVEKYVGTPIQSGDNPIGVLPDEEGNVRLTNPKGKVETVTLATAKELLTRPGYALATEADK